MRPPARAAAIEAAALHSSDDHHVAVLPADLTCTNDEGDIRRVSMASRRLLLACFGASLGTGRSGRPWAVSDDLSSSAPGSEPSRPHTRSSNRLRPSSPTTPPHPRHRDLPTGARSSPAPGQPTPRHPAGGTHRGRHRRHRPHRRAHHQPRPRRTTGPRHPRIRAHHDPAHRCSRRPTSHTAPLRPRTKPDFTLLRRRTHTAAPAGTPADRRGSQPLQCLPRDRGGDPDQREHHNPRPSIIPVERETGTDG